MPNSREPKPPPDYSDVGYVIDTINRGRCVFFLGPNIPRNKLGFSLIQEFFYFFGQKTDILVEFDDEYVIKFKKNRDRLRYTYHFKTFFEQHCKHPLEIHNKLAQIPVPLVITTSPDLSLEEAYHQKGVNLNIGIYDKSTFTVDPIISKDESAPTLYYLFGNIKYEDSLIFSHDDLLNTIFSLSNDNKLPQELFTLTNNAELFVFLGFDFSNWYYRILLRLFGLNEKGKAGIAYGGNEKIAPNIKRFYEEYFNVDFPKEDIVNYIHKLFVYFSGSKQNHSSSPSFDNYISQNGQYEASQSELSLVEEMLRKLDKNEIGSAIEVLKKVLNHSTFKTDYILISARLNALKKRQKDQNLQWDIFKNKKEVAIIRESISNIATKLKNN